MRWVKLFIILYIYVFSLFIFTNCFSSDSQVKVSLNSPANLDLIFKSPVPLVHTTLSGSTPVFVSSNVNGDLFPETPKSSYNTKDDDLSISPGSSTSDFLTTSISVDNSVSLLNSSPSVLKTPTTIRGRTSSSSVISTPVCSCRHSVSETNKNSQLFPNTKSFVSSQYTPLRNHSSGSIDNSNGMFNTPSLNQSGVISSGSPMIDDCALLGIGGPILNTTPLVSYLQNQNVIPPSFMGLDNSYSLSPAAGSAMSHANYPSSPGMFIPELIKPSTHNLSTQLGQRRISLVGRRIEMNYLPVDKNCPAKKESSSQGRVDDDDDIPFPIDEVEKFFDLEVKNQKSTQSSELTILTSPSVSSLSTPIVQSVSTPTTLYTPVVCSPYFATLPYPPSLPGAQQEPSPASSPATTTSNSDGISLKGYHHSSSSTSDEGTMRKKMMEILNGTNIINENSLSPSTPRQKNIFNGNRIFSFYTVLDEEEEMGRMKEREEEDEEEEEERKEEEAMRDGGAVGDEEGESDDDFLTNRKRKRTSSRTHENRNIEYVGKYTSNPSIQRNKQTQHESGSISPSSKRRRVLDEREEEGEGVIRKEHRERFRKKKLFIYYYYYMK
jgi:hypothetical protein